MNKLPPVKLKQNLHVTVLGVSLSVLTFLIVLPAIVGAQPGATPPTGVVNAVFNSIETTTTGIFGGDLSTGGIFSVQNYMENSRGGYPLTMSDVDGVKVTDGPLDANTDIINTTGDVTIKDNLDVHGDAFIDNAVTGSSAELANDSHGLYTIAPDTAGPLGQYGIYSIGKSGVAGFFTGSGPTVLQAYAGGAGTAFVAQSVSGVAINATGSIKNQNLTIAANGDISDSGGPVVVNDSLSVSGDIKATGGNDIGRFYSPAWLIKTIDAKSWDSHTASCDLGDIAVDCGHWNSNNLMTLQYLFADDRTCKAYVYNGNTTAQSFKIKALCFSADG